MTRLWCSLLCGMVALGTTAAAAQTTADSTCHEFEAPGPPVHFSLPYRYQLELLRADDSTGTNEFGCTARVRDAAGSLVWTAEGFKVVLDDWTNRDIDGDGAVDAVIGVDLGGGNRGFWQYFVLRLAPTFGISAHLWFSPMFEQDASGRVAIYEVVPFYGLGPSMADTPAAVLVHRLRDGALRNVTPEYCPRILADQISWQWLSYVRPMTSDARRRESREAGQVTLEIERTRAAVTSLVFQHLACDDAREAERWVRDTWPTAEAAEQLATLRATWTSRGSRQP